MNTPAPAHDNTPRLYPRLAARAVIVRDGRLLLVNATRARGDGRWCTPGGGVECGEDMKTGLAREVFEETGLTAKIGDLLWVSEYQNNDDHFHQVDIYFAAHIIDGEIDDNWQDHCGVVQERRFFSHEEIQKLEILPAYLKNGEWQDLHSAKPTYKGTEEGVVLRWKM